MTAPTEDLIARLEAEARAWESTRADDFSPMAFEAMLTEAAQALRALQQEVERLRGALEPFAKAADALRPDDPDRDRPAYATAAEYRAARSALTGSAQG